MGFVAPPEVPLGKWLRPNTSRTLVHQALFCGASSYRFMEQEKMCIHRAVIYVLTFETALEIIPL